MEEGVDIADQLERHMNSPNQTWLLGAGVSLSANIPLMRPLTERVLKCVKSQLSGTDNDMSAILDLIVSDCRADSHIEHYLTHLGDLISLSNRSVEQAAYLRSEKIEIAKPHSVYNLLVENIVSTIRWGYQAAEKDEAGNESKTEKIGCENNSIIDISSHKKFVDALFHTNRAGREHHRPAVEIFTTNYDTLIEDSLALLAVNYSDGFVGGAVGYWSLQNYESRSGVQAIVSKLHGSIDWYRPTSGPAGLLRLRHGDTYPEKTDGAVLIYPQATKYMNTQRDPFAEIFQRFRIRLSKANEHVLLICGYSFGDEHINAEIEIAMSSAKSQLTVVAFSNESSGGLPEKLSAWLKGIWGERLFVVSPKGLYQGKSGPYCQGPNGERDWWKFDGVSTLLKDGLPKDIQGAPR